MVNVLQMSNSFNNSHKLTEARAEDEKDILRVWDSDNAPDRHYLFRFEDNGDVGFSHVEIRGEDGDMDIDEEADVDVGISKWIVREGYSDKVVDGYETVVKMKIGKGYMKDEDRHYLNVGKKPHE